MEIKNKKSDDRLEKIFRLWNYLDHAASVFTQLFVIKKLFFVLVTEFFPVTFTISLILIGLISPLFLGQIC